MPVVKSWNAYTIDHIGDGREVIDGGGRWWS